MAGSTVGRETVLVGMGAVLAAMVSLAVCTVKDYRLLYGDAVAHLGIARGLIDTRTPGLGQLGGVWLPLPHLLMLPFVWRMDWWQNGLAGAWPAMICYVLAVMGMYRVALKLLPRRWALVATAFFGLNANLLYLAVTPMTEPLFLAEFVWVVVVVWEIVEGLGAAGREQATTSARAKFVGLSTAQRLRAASVEMTSTPDRLSATRRLRSASVEMTSGGVGSDAASAKVTLASGDGDVGALTGRMVLLGMLVLAATMTRYDGWVLGAAAWCVVGWSVWQADRGSEGVWRAVMPGLVTMTLLCVAGPGLWFWYNHVFGHDWLDFMRGPYSAKEIDRKTSPPGAHKYWGWHNPAWSLMLYARTAQVDAAAWEMGWVVAAAALWGSWKRWFAERGAGPGSAGGKVWLLLWFPLPFYVYSISYGSVPIFIPQLYPHSFYNSRYGMEMLPVLAVMGMYGVWRLAERAGRWTPLVERVVVPAGLMLVLVNLAWMTASVPLVLKEGMVNSRGRLALDEPLARVLAGFRPGTVILMENSDRVGALQMAGIPLKQTIGPGDYYGWQRGLATPAKTADYVLATAGTALDAAVKAHPEGLTELEIVCTYRQACVRVYASGVR